MAGTASDEPTGKRGVDGLSTEQHRELRDALSKSLSLEEVETDTPSTSSSFWDVNDCDNGGGLKPSDLYATFTWKIEKYSQINRRELRSTTFTAGGCTWCLSLYPQGCDVGDHLSLFLCVPNHERFLPGWGQLAQFTIVVVNKDPKKTKCSDTLHHFWKKEHDWGWKKFVEKSNLSDGFVDADTLVVKAQVQVIREKAERPFRCLAYVYGRELVSLYYRNIENICHRFIEAKREKLRKLIEDKDSWSSYCEFWRELDQKTRDRISREKKDTILKAIVKNFFIKQEVTSTILMDSLYNGLKAVEAQSNNTKGKAKLSEGDEIPLPIILIEKNTFVLADDVMVLLEGAAVKLLPRKHEKGPENPTEDGSSRQDEVRKESIDRVESHLTELGQKTVEVFAFAHIFSNIEAAYLDALSWKRQEELLRELEAE